MKTLLTILSLSLTTPTLAAETTCVEVFQEYAEDAKADGFSALGEREAGGVLQILYTKTGTKRFFGLFMAPPEAELTTNPSAREIEKGQCIFSNGNTYDYITGHWPTLKPEPRCRSTSPGRTGRV